MNSREASKLISKSILGTLTSEESEKVEQALASDPNARAFAQLSHAINNTVADIGGSELEPAGPGLSHAAKSRLMDSVITAMERPPQASSLNDEFALPPDANNSGAMPGSTSSPSAVTPPTDSAAGGRADLRQSKSKFKLLREIGSGGLGKVWLARDEKLNRNVALKEMNDTALQLPQAWGRFNREAEITGHLEHPNVVSMYQYGNESQSGEPFYVMRFVGKRTLADAISDYHDQCATGSCDPLMLHRLLAAFLDVCQAVAYAHSRGVIHRDLKPENVALDNFGQVIVLDWGLAKITEDAELSVRLSGNTDLTDQTLAQTTAGEIIGTPLYMAPEQAAGRFDEIDRQTDVYGLGGILFAILTGEAPHQATHQSQISESENQSPPLTVRETLSAIAEKEAVAPRRLKNYVSYELDRICQQAMAFKKYARYQTVIELSTAVERWMVDQGSRKSKYDNLRMEGRELRNNIQSAVRDLETNVRFMSKLPPIQELIRVDEPTEFATWRDRLSTIFTGLLNAKSDFCSVVYSRIQDGEFTEMVRVQRHSTVHSNIRSIPRSRLRTGPVDEFSRETILHAPDEVHTSLTCSSLCHVAASSDADEDQVTIVAGVPVFDDQTEEIFGAVFIECDLDRVLREELNRRIGAKNIVVACDTYHIIIHANKEVGLVEENASQPLVEKLPQFKTAQEVLQTKLEYIDETDRKIYGSRLWLINRKNKKHGLMFLLER